MRADVRILVQGAVAIAAAHGIRCTKPALLAPATNLLIDLRPSPVVARLLTRTAWLGGDAWEAAAREVAVARAATARGAAVVPPTDELPPGPHDLDGMPVTFWRRLPARGVPATARAAMSALAELHAALDDCPCDLPVMAPVGLELPRLLDALERRATTRPARLALLRLAFTRLTTELAALREPCLAIHGDAHVGNLVAAFGKLWWTDLEHCSRGPRGWDLACLLHGQPDRLARLEAVGVPSDQARLFEQLRTLQLSVWRELGGAVRPGRR